VGVCGGGLFASTGRTRATGTIDPIALDSTASLLNASGGLLTDDSLVAVRGESTATNTDTDGNGDAVDYGSTPIPMVAVDGNVAGIGTPLVPNDVDFGFGTEEFLLNLWDELIGGGTVLWDEGHGQFYQLDSGANGGSGPGFEQFEAYAEANGYVVESTADIQADLGGADAVVITSPSDAFTAAELSALSTFVANGGVAILHDQSDFRNFDETVNLNDVAAALGVGFRFNDDQVIDGTNNAGADFVPTTTNFNDATFPGLFADRPGIDEGNALDPTETYTVDVVDVADGDTVDVQFDDGRVESIRVLGVDTPETRGNAEFERPEEWEGLADRVGLQTVQFGSTSSLLSASGDPLTDESPIAVAAEESAYNVDTDGNADAVDYPEDTPIPLVAIDGAVAGLGSPLADDDALQFNADLDNEEFLLTLWDRVIGGGTVRWDESHGQFYDLARFSTFEAYAEDNGYAVEAGSAIPSDTSSVDGLVITSPDAFSASELSDLSSFVADGGGVVLHDQSDFNDFDETANLNDVAAELGVGFRFNDDQVQDNQNNTGRSFRPTTGRFDPRFDVFAEREGVDEELVIRSGGGPVEELAFGEGTASLLNASGTPLTDDSLVVARAESSAFNDDSDGNGDAVDYGSTPIPVAALDGSVAAFGGLLVNDGQEFAADNEEFVLNVWDEVIGGGTVRWDGSHGQFWDLAKFSTFEGYAEDNGYAVENGSSIPSDTTSVDGLVITSPDGFSSGELSDLSSFVADGGGVVLHDQSDFSDFDRTANLNAIAAELGVGVRFNDDQVFDPDNNLGNDFQPTTANLNDARFPGLFAERTGLDDVETFWDAEYPYLAYHASLGSEFAADALLGETVDISFDPASANFNGGVRDPFGRVLAYVDYDATGDGTRDTLYNERLIEQGYARSYASSLSQLDALLDAELGAREAGIGVWRQSNPDLTPEWRNTPVEDVYVPKAARVESTEETLGDDRTFVYAGSGASPAGAPLGAIDRVAGVAVVGGLVIDEGYEGAEGFAVDTSGFDNFPLLTNVIDRLTDRDGPVLVAGGGGQFNVAYALSGEDVAYYQRYLEGVDVGQEAINDLTNPRLDDARALIVTAPTAELTDAELSAVASFAADGGAVVLVAGADAPTGARANLAEIGAAVGTDLRVTGEAVTDGTANLDGDPTLPVTDAFSPELDLYGPFEPGAAEGTTLELSFAQNPLLEAGEASADLVLSNAPDGIESVEVTISVANTDVALIESATDAEPLTTTREPMVADDGSSITLAATDGEDAIGSGDAPVTLGTIAFDPEGPGRTTVGVEVTTVIDDDGTSVDPTAIDGALVVTGAAVDCEEARNCGRGDPRDTDGDRGRGRGERGGGSDTRRGRGRDGSSGSQNGGDGNGSR